MGRRGHDRFKKNGGMQNAESKNSLDESEPIIQVQYVFNEEKWFRWDKDDKISNETSFPLFFNLQIQTEAEIFLVTEQNFNRARKWL